MRALRWILWSLTAIVLLMVAGLAGYRFEGMPQTDGELAVTGVQAPARIVRDVYGIPHVFAASDRDAFFALGFLHAQDRLWQLEMDRRIVAGRLAEILGPAALGTDRFLRTIGVQRNAERVTAQLDEATRASLQAYADGVNAGIGITRREPWKLSPEFLILGVRPQDWTIADSVGWMTMMAWDLSGNHANELLRFALSQKLSTAQVEELLETDPPVALPDLVKLYKGLDRGPVAQLLDGMPPGDIEGIGSNNWVVDGDHSSSGKPLLANDPHLGLNAPALWYFAHLSAPGLDVIGATLPGLPSVVLGRNRHIAWGVTNTGPDTQDLYLERIDAADASRYATPDGTLPFVVRNETIRVKGAADVVLQVRETRHGPVISDVHEDLKRALEGQHLGSRYVLAFKWTALSGENRMMSAGLGMNRAANWDEFVAALRDWSAPQQNFVYADVDGNIGFIAPGRVPIRKPENDLMGLAPAPGWDDRYDWTGYIPFDELPRAFRPAGGTVVTANQNILPPGYPYFVSAEFTQPYRHDRIRERLAARERHDVESFASIQSDVLSKAVEELLPILRRANPSSEPARLALARIGAWNGQMSADTAEPLIATAWIDRLRRRIFADEVGEKLFPLLERQRVRTGALVRALTVPGRAPWCDDVATPAIESCAQMVDLALEDAVQDLRARYGDDIAAWKWGEAHVAVSEHRPFSRQALLAKFFEIRTPSPGDTNTIDVGRNDPWDPKDPFASHWAPSLRAIYDLANPENSRFVYSTGQSGHVLSPHYRDMTERWARVEYLPMVTDRAAIEKDAYSTLTVVPGR